MTDRTINRITKFEYYDIVSKKYHDIANMVFEVKWVTDMTTAGVLTFKMFRNTNKTNGSTAIKVSSGDRVVFEWDNKRIFQGWVFVREQDEKGVYSVTAYDNSRYLKGTGTYMWGALSSSERFTVICNDLGIPNKDDHFDTYRSPAEISDGKTYFDMIQTAMDNTRRARGTRFFIMDDGFGTLVHTSTQKHDTATVISDIQGTVSQSYTATIDNDTANRITVVREDQKTKQRRMYTIQNDERVQRWGPLTYAETVTDEINDAQLKQKANELLAEKVAEKVEFSFTALGNAAFRAGIGFISDIKANYEELGARRHCIAEKVTHNFDTEWTMDVDVKVE